MYDEFNILRRLIREQGTPEIQDAWDEVEDWAGYVFKNDLGLPDEGETK